MESDQIKKLLVVEDLSGFFLLSKSVDCLVSYRETGQFSSHLQIYHISGILLFMGIMRNCCHV